MMVGQIASVLVLLASSGVLLESLRRLLTQDLGYRPESVVVVDLRQDGFETNGDVCRMYRALRDRLMGIPGVEAVGTISSVPLTGRWTFDERPDVVGHTVPEADRPSVAATFVAFDYFRVMGIPLIAGRYFLDTELQDDGYGQRVILNEAAATLLYPGRSALGGRFTVGSNPDRVLEVIGVVKDTRDVRLDERPRPRMYWQYAFGGAQVVIRGAVANSVLIPMVSEVVTQMDTRVHLESVNSLPEIISRTIADRRFVALMVAAYTFVAVAVAAVGVFGVVSYQVARRRNEFGIRLALGESRARLIRQVLWQTGLTTGMGLIVGLAMSVATNRLIGSQIFGLSAHDPRLLMGVSVILVVITMLASLNPAIRAASVDPVETLRAE